MPNKNPANPGGKGKLPGYPGDKNLAGTPDPRPDEFPGKAPDIYAGKKHRDTKSSETAENPNARRNAPDENPDLKQPRGREGSNPAPANRDHSGGENRDRSAGRDQNRQ